MYELQYLIVATIGSVSLLFAIGLYRWHNEVELFGAISLGCWAVLALSSNNVVVLTDAGEKVVVGSFPVQLLSLGLALVSLFAIYGALTGSWPPGYESDKEAPI